MRMRAPHGIGGAAHIGSALGGIALVLAAAAAGKPPDVHDAPGEVLVPPAPAPNEGISVHASLAHGAARIQPGREVFYVPCPATLTLEAVVRIRGEESIEWIGRHGLEGRLTGSKVVWDVKTPGRYEIELVVNRQKVGEETEEIRRTLRFTALEVEPSNVAVHITFPGPGSTPPVDLNGDLQVNHQDRDVFWSYYGCSRSDENYNALADWNSNGDVDLEDLVRFVDSHARWEGREVGISYGNGLILPVTVHEFSANSFGTPAPLFQARTEPAGLEGWIEWRHGDQFLGSGAIFTRKFAKEGHYDIGAGIFGGPAHESRELTTYKTVIWETGLARRLVSNSDVLKNGVVYQLEAKTSPPGYEDYVHWFASTKYGAAEPRRGRGRFFTTRFSGTWGTEGFQWLGVQADDDYFNQDQKFPDLIDDFTGPDQTAADAAYNDLYGLGAAAISPLIKITDLTGTFRGSDFVNERTSRPFPVSIPIRHVAIYLIDGILLGDPAPHYSATLFKEPPQNPDVTLDQAINAYNSWWTLNEGLTLEDLRLQPHPLEGTLIRWNGPILFDQDAPSTGTEKENSKTPYKKTEGGGPDCADGSPDGPDPGGAGDPYAWRHSPRDVNGPRPYNCLAWAIGCLTDRWIQTFGQPGALYTDVLTHYGYNTTRVDCAGQCPAGKGPKVMLVSHIKNTGGFSEDPFQDSKWVHAMKQEPDGEWSSKNAGHSLWENITDPDAFINKHYPAPAGQTVVTHCYCKN